MIQTFKIYHLTKIQYLIYNLINYRKSLHLPPRQVDMFVAKHAGESTDGLSPRRVENEDPVIHCISGNWHGGELRDERVGE